MADAMGFTCIKVPKGWCVVDRYSSPVDIPTFVKYADARKEAERLNEKASDVNRKRN